MYSERWPDIVELNRIHTSVHPRCKPPARYHAQLNVKRAFVKTYGPLGKARREIWILDPKGPSHWQIWTLQDQRVPYTGKYGYYPHEKNHPTENMDTTETLTLANMDTTQTKDTLTLTNMDHTNTDGTLTLANIDINPDQRNPHTGKYRY